MIKTLNMLLKQDKESITVPKSVQDIIPVKAIWEDGMFLVGNGAGMPALSDAWSGKYSKTYRFDDINYAAASREDKEAMFLEYSELLNSFDIGATYKITIVVKNLDKEEFKRTILVPMKGDALDPYREEYNKILLDEATGANGFVQEKYLTVSVHKKSAEEARNFFSRVSADLTAHFSRLGSRATAQNAEERLRVFHDFYRPDEAGNFRFDIKSAARKGHNFKDAICPDMFEFQGDKFRMGGKFGRVIFLKDYANYIKDGMVSELCDFNTNMALSLDIIPIPTDEAVREVENRVLGVETNISATRS